MGKSYYGKIILFGEYSMIFDPNALLVPFRKAKAEWQMGLDSGRAIASNRNLKEFCSYLTNNPKLSGLLDTTLFRHDLNSGLYLESTIPNGYGLGSSGAVVAAVYERYAKSISDDFSALKSILAEMENSFHGSSSGNDPLASFLGKPYRITEKNKIEVIDFELSESPIRAFLIDTKVKSSTGPLVHYFVEQRKQQEYSDALQQRYLPCVASCIDAFLEHRVSDFFCTLSRLTSMQMEFLRPMITENTLHLFSEKIDFHFGVKIFGSGGGGFVLGFTDDVASAARLVEGFDVVWL